VSEQKPPRVFVTGIGVVTPLGTGTKEFWTSLTAGKTGVQRIERFPTDGLPVKIAAEVKDFEPEKFLDRRDLKRTDRFVQMAIGAALMAVEDASLTIEPENAERVGVLIGSGIGGLTTLMDQHELMLERGPDRVSPLLVPMMIADMASGYVSILTGAKGPNSTVVTACATGANAIGEGLELLRRGAADAMIVGGAEAAIHPITIAGFANSKAMATAFNDDPEAASRPFDVRHCGFVLGEGAGVLILETEDHVRARGGKVYVELAGYGMSGDAHHIVQPAPDGNGVARAVVQALNNAKIERSEVGYINAHATSTPVGDRAEVNAYRSVFGDRVNHIPISSTKGGTAHMLGAAGAVEAAVCVLTIHRGELAPTVNQEELDPECQIDSVPNKSRKASVKVAVSNNSGFGGHNAVLVFRQAEPETGIKPVQDWEAS
jgi:3-oxoacyl-[acyl-carrier-protein] synthase II